MRNVNLSAQTVVIEVFHSSKNVTHIFTLESLQPPLVLVRFCKWHEMYFILISFSEEKKGVIRKQYTFRIRHYGDEYAQAFLATYVLLRNM